MFWIERGFVEINDAVEQEGSIGSHGLALARIHIDPDGLHAGDEMIEPVGAHDAAGIGHMAGQRHGDAGHPHRRARLGRAAR